MNGIKIERAPFSSGRSVVRNLLLVVGASVLGFLWPAPCPATSVVQGITFATETGSLYVPLEGAAHELRWRIDHDDKTMHWGPNNTSLVSESLRRLVDGTELVTIADLREAGAIVTDAPAGGGVNVSAGGFSFEVLDGPKRVEISLAKQRLWAWQGSRLVLESRISSGRHNGTPTGDFSAGPYKARTHFSHLFQNAPMPWSVQINGHIFIHGFTYVPDYPASHGCIRLPLDGGNPARFFYEWVDVGTPVHVTP